jgi:hypothetical protein
MAVTPVVWWLLFLIPAASGLTELTIRLIKKEFFPSVVDIVAEIDSGGGEFSSLLAFQKNRGISISEVNDDRERTVSTEGERNGTDDDKKEGEADGDNEGILRYSKVLLGGGGKQMFSIDWISLQGVLDTFSPQEQANLGVQVLVFFIFSYSFGYLLLGCFVYLILFVC